MEITTQARTPVHLWIVGVLATLFNAFGCYDYVMTRTVGAAHIEKMMSSVDSAGYMAYINSFPTWVSIAWALGVWGGLAGAILLLARHRWSVPTLFVSFLGALLGIGYQVANPAGGVGAQTGFSAYAPITIIAIALAIFLYARAMRARGVLG